MSSNTVIHQHISDDGIIEICQEGNHLSLYFGSSAKQSEMDIQQPEKLILAYTQAMMASLLFFPSPEKTLLIGLGGGSLVRFMLHHLPDCTIDVVEYREDVVKLAYGYFKLPISERLNITIADGYDFLLSQQHEDKKYDLILIDAFDHEGIAHSIRSPQFFDACYESLSDTGITAINLWRSEKDQYSETISNFESSFRFQAMEIPVKEKGNVIAFATRARDGFPSFKTLKPLANILEQKLDLTIGTYLRELRRHNRWRALTRFF